MSQGFFKQQAGSSIWSERTCRFMFVPCAKRMDPLHRAACEIVRRTINYALQHRALRSGVAALLGRFLPSLGPVMNVSGLFSSRRRPKRLLGSLRRVRCNLFALLFGGNLDTVGEFRRPGL